MMGKDKLVEIECPICGEKLIENHLTTVGQVPRTPKGIVRDTFYFVHGGTHKEATENKKCRVYDAVLKLGYKVDT